MTLELFKDPLVLYYIAALVTAYPLVRIFKRAGFSPEPVAFLIVPMVGYLIALGALVFRKWPALQGEKR
jgi:hypothetical protein